MDAGGGTTEPIVVMSAGAPFEEAAAWVGASCHAELALHEQITDLLAGGIGPADVSAVWTVRSHRAELAEAWHRRLPELRELPREGLIVGDASFEAADASGPTAAGAAAGVDSIVRALEALERRYAEHLSVAVGPADGPVADTLIRALALTADDLLALSPSDVDA